MSRGKHGSSIPGWVAMAACLLALTLAVFGPNAAAEPPPPPTAGLTLDPTLQSGRAPLRNDAELPIQHMPPGTATSPVPSDEIFPPQTLTIRFNHALHLKSSETNQKERDKKCFGCHLAAKDSEAASDRLLPDPVKTCDNCHLTDHSNLAKVTPGDGAASDCKFCHLGDKAGEGGKVAPMVVPRANLIFSHKQHLASNLSCGQCHGHIDQLELATRDQLPRMAGCFSCHGMTGPSAGKAKGTCTACHVTQPDGRIQTAFTTGNLVPPRWLHNAGHDADWIERHKSVAADDSAFCGSCHTSKYCTDCHDGKVRPRKVHPNDWLSMHPQAARQDNPRCSSCHQEQTFCADCHRRTGVARDAASGTREGGRRFHPPPAVWTTAPRSPQHHSWEAERNLNACVSCHTERDCTTCHATKGLSGGQGVSPHPGNFKGKCAAAMQRNPRPCLVCHQPNDASLRSCR